MPGWRRERELMAIEEAEAAAGECVPEESVEAMEGW
jgi:hypothetical protein